MSEKGACVPNVESNLLATRSKVPAPAGSASKSSQPGEESVFKLIFGIAVAQADSS